MSDLAFSFHVPFCGTVDEANGVIRGVSLMTGNLTAEGHDLEVDETTLRQVLACAKKTGKIPVKLDHGSGITSLCGYIDGATAVIEAGADGRNKVRGDWHLLRTHEQYPTLIERARLMPECFGMSAAFKGSGELLKAGEKRGRKAARCERLLAVDCVTQPAANPDGLFDAVSGRRRGAVDRARRGMSDENQNPNDPQMPAWAAQLLEKLTTIETKVAGFEQFQNDVNAALNEPTLDEMAGMDDAQLAELGYSREQVEAAIAEAQTAGEYESGDPNAGQGEQNAGGAGQSNGGGAPAAATSMSAGDRALKEVVELKAQIARQAQAEERAEVEHAFAVVEEKVTALSEQNAELVTRNEQLEAEVKALRLFNKTGMSKAAPGVEGVTLFNGKGAAAGTFEALVSTKITELKTGNARLADAAARSQAVQFCIRTHTDAYADYRQRGGKIQF